MLNLKKVAVTGGLASGKSTVCHLLKQFGAYVVSSDEIVHNLLLNNSEVKLKVIKLLGNDIIVKDVIDRSIIAQKVFNQPLLLKSLENILHPYVLDSIKKQYEIVNKHQKYPLFVAEVPLLFEANMEFFFDIIVSVTVDKQIAEKRFIEKTGKSSAEFESRYSKQMTPSDKAKKAHYVLENNLDMEQLLLETQELYSSLTTP
ncbi:Dephospho-CoA kinase [Candidatus Rubidus massiliensis]|nr:MAG: dephospho-CoA kinase [Chlamydia sp. 32-24]CDZ80042.1 Dephospho-CoA kinase [Candidatus Rubidus massiliensis]